MAPNHLLCSLLLSYAVSNNAINSYSVSAINNGGVNGVVNLLSCLSTVTARCERDSCNSYEQKC